jgi:hypothetical protein
MQMDIKQTMENLQKNGIMMDYLIKLMIKKDVGNLLIKKDMYQHYLYFSWRSHLDMRHQ